MPPPPTSTCLPMWMAPWNSGLSTEDEAGQPAEVCYDVVAPGCSLNGEAKDERLVKCCGGKVALASQEGHDGE